MFRVSHTLYDVWPFGIVGTIFRIFQTVPNVTPIFQTYQKPQFGIDTTNIPFFIFSSEILCELADVVYDKQMELAWTRRRL